MKRWFCLILSLHWWLARRGEIPRESLLAPAAAPPPPLLSFSFSFLAKNQEKTKVMPRKWVRTKNREDRWASVFLLPQPKRRRRRVERVESTNRTHLTTLVNLNLVRLNSILANGQPVCDAGCGRERSTIRCELRGEGGGKK